MRLLRNVLLGALFAASPALADSSSSTNYSVSSVGLPVPPFATYYGMLLSGGALAGASGTVWGTAPTGLNVLGVNANVLSLPSLAAGANTIGAISNSSFGISGTLPGFASAPTVNIGTWPALSAGTNSIGSITNTAFGISGSLPGFASTPTVNVGALPALASGSNVIGSISNTGFGINGTLPAFTSVPTVNVGTFPALSAGANTIGAVTQASGPWTNNLTQVNGTNLGSPTAWGSAPTGGTVVPNVNANIVAGTVTASFSGYSATAVIAPITVTNSSARYALPAGTTVVVYNTGSNNAYISLGNTSVTATLSDDVVYPNCWATYAVGAAVDVAALTSTSTTTLNVTGGSGLPGGGCAAVLTGASTVTANQGTAGGSPWPVSMSTLPAGTNAIGSITNTAFGVSGTLPAFAATPTFNLGTLGGAATAANQEVTVAGVTATSAQGVQGVTGGIPLPVGGSVTANAGTGTFTVAGTVTANAGTNLNTSALATSANQEVTAAGSSALSAQGVQGVTGGVPMPTSVTSLPLPSGAATAANQEVTTAGSTASSAQAVQGVTGGVAMPMSVASLPLPSGAATAANQEVTAAGTSGSNAQGIQGVTNGVPVSTVSAPDATIATGSITVIDSGVTCATNTPGGAQTVCTGTPTAGSFVSGQVTSAGTIAVNGAATTGGTLSAMQFTTEFSRDNINWYSRGLFLDSLPNPIWKSTFGAPFEGTAPGGGIGYYRVRATTFTVSSGAPSIAVTIAASQKVNMMYIGNLPTSANGSASLAATNIQGNGNSANPVNTNQQQVANTVLGAPTAWGAVPSGNVIGANVNCVSGCAASSATVSHASTTALAVALSVKTAAGTLSGFNCTAITGGTAGYCVVYNATSTPGTGALTGSLVLDSCYFDTTARGCSLSRIPANIAYSAGIQVLVTSAVTPYTYTTGTDTAFISADYN